MSIGFKLFGMTGLLIGLYWIVCGFFLATYKRLHLRTGLGGPAPGLFDPSFKNTFRILGVIFGGDVGKIRDSGLTALMYLTRLLFIVVLASWAASIWVAITTL